MKAPADQQSFTLPNGLKVVLVERPFGKGFTAFLNLRAGSQNDPSHAIGVAHLSEHLAFTEPTRALGRELSEQGVYVNAYTAPQRTAFYTSGHRDFLQQSLRLLASILEVRDIDSQACQHEREIVYQEMFDNEPASLCERTAAFWRLCDRVNGDPNWRYDYQERMKSIKNLSSEEVNAFRTAYYRADQAALAIVAPCDMTESRQMVEELFGAIASQENPPTTIVETSDWKEVPEFNFHFDLWPNIWLQVTNTAPDAQAVTRLAASMLSHLLGGGEHSEMYARFRKESAEAYNATADYDALKNHTSITSFVSINKKSAVDALEFLIERGQQFADEGIDDKLREGLLERIRRRWEMRMESHFRLAEYISIEALRAEGSSMIDLRPNSEILNRTTKEELCAATGRLFDPQNRKIFVGGRIGPVGRWRMRNVSS